jgi:hypothetical protein
LLYEVYGEYTHLREKDLNGMRCLEGEEQVENANEMFSNSENG